MPTTPRLDHENLDLCAAYLHLATSLAGLVVLLDIGIVRTISLYPPHRVRLFVEKLYGE